MARRALDTSPWHPWAVIAVSPECSTTWRRARGGAAICTQRPNSANSRSGMTPLGDSALAERQLRAGQAWRVTGQAARAGELAGAANDATADGPLRAAALRLLAAVAPDEPRGLALGDRALYEARADPRLLVEVRGERANRLMALGRQDDAVAEARETVAAAEALGDRELLAGALAQFAWQSRLAGRPRRAELDRAVAMAPGSHVGWFGYSPTVCRAVCLVWDDSLDEARAILERVAHGARERGDEITLATALRHLAELECPAGRFVASETLALECLGLVAPETSALEDSAHHYLLASALAHRGCVDEARSHAREGARRSQKAGEQIYRVLHESIQGFLALSLGDAVAADRHLRPLWPTVTAMGFGEP